MKSVILSQVQSKQQCSGIRGEKKKTRKKTKEVSLNLALTCTHHKPSITVSKHQDTWSPGLATRASVNHGQLNKVHEDLCFSFYRDLKGIHL